MAIKKISEGAEADIYEAHFMGVDSIIKFRRPKPYLISQIEDFIRVSRTKTESRMLLSAGRVARVPHLLLVSKYCIVMEKVNGIQASKLEKFGNKNASLAGESLAALHSADIIHGDFTKANFLIDGSNLFLIDFGLSYSSNSDEAKAFDLLLLKRSLTKNEFSVAKVSYSKSYPKSSQILKKLAEIERRGRYQSRTLDAA